MGGMLPKHTISQTDGLHGNHHPADPELDFNWASLGGEDIAIAAAIKSKGKGLRPNVIPGAAYQSNAYRARRVYVLV